jgi:acetyl-CoA acetyltransferase
MKSLVAECVNGALEDAGLTKEQLQGAWVGNASQGLFDGQECIRGQVVLRAMGIGKIPVVNVENACASSATALNGAWAMVALGEIDVALVVGMEKMYTEDRQAGVKGFMAGMDVEVVKQFMEAMKQNEEEALKKREQSGAGKKERTERRSVFMDLYAMGARMHMEKYGTTQRHLAAIASKNHFHSSMNPLAQYQKKFSIEEVIASPEVAFPLTRLMCAPIGDGAAAAIIASEDFAKKIGCPHAVEIAACCLASGQDPEPGREPTLTMLAKKAYEKAGIGPEDIDVAEVHDATAFGEVSSLESLNICPVGEAGPMAEAGDTTLGGRIPVNVSGGLESQGHPVGATGCRQVVELAWHLGNRVGERQVKGAKVGLAQNAGGSVGSSEAALSVTILKR